MEESVLRAGHVPVGRGVLGTDSTVTDDAPDILIQVYQNRVGSVHGTDRVLWPALR